MSQALVRRILGSTYEYRELDSYFEEHDLAKYKSNFSKRAISLAKKWNQELNSEWIVRHYLAVKMILSSTLIYNSLEYSESRNVQISEPYLRYYTLLCACRAVVFTSMDNPWLDGKIVTLPHSKILSATENCLKSISKKEGSRVANQLGTAKANRELFSYAFPSNGDGNKYKKITTQDTESIATLLLEIAQMNSEILEKSILKYAPDFDSHILEEYFFKAVEYDNNGDSFVDDEDYYRMGYISRKQPFPHSLYLTLSEGMVDDFFEAWWIERCNDDDDLFNPDEQIRVLFDLP